jgi:hypothetical protein
MENQKTNKSKSMETGYYAEGGAVGERKKIQDKIEVMKAAIESEDTPDHIKESMKAKLPELEKRLAEYKTPPPPPRPAPSPKEEGEEETMADKKKKWAAELQDVVVAPEKAEEITEKVNGVKAHITGKIDGEFEGTIQTEGGAPVKIKEKVSVQVQDKPQRNVTIPGNTLWVNIEDKYKGIMRNVLYASGIKYTSKTVDGYFQVIVDTQAKVEKIVKLYNMKRTKKKDKPVTLEQVTGKYEEGGKLWIGKAVKKKGSLREEAKKEGLLRNDKEKLSEADLKKLEKKGPKWRKRVALARTFRKMKHK